MFRDAQLLHCSWKGAPEKVPLAWSGLLSCSASGSPSCALARNPPVAAHVLRGVCAAAHGWASAQPAALLLHCHSQTHMHYALSSRAELSQSDLHTS
jgi:hypothetical protein